MRDQVLRWLAHSDLRRVLFSDLTRALVTNDKSRRARSPESRNELRGVLAQLESEGLVVLSQVNTTGRGQRGMAVALAHPPMKPVTHAGGQQDVER